VIEIVKDTNFNLAMNKAKQERDWTVEPYSAKDFALFSDFESELENYLQEQMGILQLLWNATSKIILDPSKMDDWNRSQCSEQIAISWGRKCSKASFATLCTRRL